MASSYYRLEDFVRVMERWGLVDVLLPFLLIFVVFFAILQKTRILGEKKKNLNVAFALIVSALAVIPHVLRMYPANADVIAIMNNALPNVSLVIVAIVMVLILIGLLGGEAHWLGGSLSGWIAFVAFIAVVWIFGASAGWWNGSNFFERYFGGDTVAIVIMLLVFAIVVWWVTSEPGEKAGDAMTGSFMKNLGDFFKQH